MAKYEINYFCGHSGYVNIIGPQKERERKIDYLEGQLCPECKKKEREEKNKETIEKAKEKAKEKNIKLPLLTGSLAQIKWAEAIRAEFIIGFILNNYINKEEAEDLRDFVLKTVTDAQFWIDNRGTFFKENESKDRALDILEKLRIFKSLCENLPKLSGVSEKQINFAEKKRIFKIYYFIFNRPNSSLNKRYDQIRDNIYEKTSAKDWIEKSPEELVGKNIPFFDF